VADPVAVLSDVWFPDCYCRFIKFHINVRSSRIHADNN